MIRLLFLALGCLGLPGLRSYAVPTTTVPGPLLTISQFSDTTLQVTWPGCGTLQVASDLRGPWVDVPNALSPYLVVPTEISQFYRLGPILDGDTGFMGTNATDPGANCLLVLQAASRQFEFYGTNATTGEIDTGIITADEWEDVPGTNGSPDQLVFDGLFGTLEVSGVISLCPDFSGYVDLITEANERIRYLIGLAQIHIDGDGDQDGVVSGSAVERAGKDRDPGVITFNNLDDDDGDGIADNQDNLINGPADLADMAEIIIRRIPVIPAGWTVSLTLNTVQNGEPAVGGLPAVGVLDVVRVFSRNPGPVAPAVDFGTAILGGPGGNSEFVLPANAVHLVDLTTLKAGNIELRAEGLERAFAASIKLRLDLKNAAGTTISTDQLQLKVAPLLLLPHNQDVEDTYVSQIAGADSLAYCTMRFPGVTPLGVNDMIIPGALNGLVPGVAAGDQWAQDQFQIGYQQTPYQPQGMYVVLDSKRPGGLTAFPPTLLGPDFGYIQVETPGLAATSLDSFGNLEVSPPCTVAGVNYPLGRIYFGGNNGGPGARQMDPRLVAFLRRQQVQSPVQFYSDWLVVGHVDEFISIVPDPTGTFGWKVVLADPRKAMDILTGKAGQPKVGKGFHIPRYTTLPIGGAVIDTIDKLVVHPVTAPAAAIPAAAGPPGGPVIPAVPAMTTIQQFSLRGVDVTLYGGGARNGGLKAAIQTAFGLAAGDFISAPTLFDRQVFGGVGRAVAVTPGLVNGADYQGVFIAPEDLLHNDIPGTVEEDANGNYKLDPGEDLNGNGLLDTLRDPFQIYFNSVMPAGVTAEYIDDWSTYHLLDGEVHCGSNDKREIPVATPWWR